MTDIELFHLSHPFLGANCPVVDQALVFQMVVEQAVQMTVGGFLARKQFHILGVLGLQIGREGVGVLHRIQLDHARGVLHDIGLHGLQVWTDEFQKAHGRSGL